MNMNNREIALKNLSAQEFTLWEMHLYLDTHPDDLRFVERYNKNKMKYSVMKNEFEEKYYYLTAESAEGVEWLKGPWPWENEECGC